MKNQGTKWVLGVDPGFNNTGAVLRLVHDKAVVEAACWRNEETQQWSVLRSMSICIPMIETLLGWVQKHDIDFLEVCIEEPIYNNNPKILMMQMSLYLMIQIYVYDYLVPHVQELYLTVVNNKTSKSKLAHDGNATKQQMIAASPWAGDKDVTHNQAHTLADSYAHSLSALTEQYPLHKLKQYMVAANYVMDTPDEEDVC